MKDLNPQIVCADGFKMSVQGNQNAYCQPRNDQGPYYQVECGFPSEVPLTDELKEFAECCGTDDYTQTVYGYVPAAIVLAEFEAHGGIVFGKMP
jgi:hypothetical protein